MCLVGSRSVVDGWEILHFKSEAIRAYFKYLKSLNGLRKLFLLKIFPLHVCKRSYCCESICTLKASLGFPYNQLFLSSIKLGWGCSLDFLSQPQPYHISAESAPNLLIFVALSNSSHQRGWKEKEKRRKKKNLLWNDFFSILLVLFGRKLYCVSNQPEILSLPSLCGSLITHQVYDSSVSTIGLF